MNSILTVILKYRATYGSRYDILEYVLIIRTFLTSVKESTCIWILIR